MKQLSVPVPRAGSTGIIASRLRTEYEYVLFLSPTGIVLAGHERMNEEIMLVNRKCQ